MVAGRDRLPILMLRLMIRASRRCQRKYDTECILHYHTVRVRACLISVMLLFDIQGMQENSNKYRLVGPGLGNYDKDCFKKALRVRKR